MVLRIKAGGSTVGLRSSADGGLPETLQAAPIKLLISLSASSPMQTAQIDRDILQLAWLHHNQKGVGGNSRHSHTCGFAEVVDHLSTMRGRSRVWLYKG